MPGESFSMSTTSQDMEKSYLWSVRKMVEPETLPFSFNYSGRKIRGIPREWSPGIQRRRIDANIIETVFEGTDPETGLCARLECLEYQDYPVVEWVAWLENRGSQASPLIEDLLGLDGDYAGGAPKIHHCNGDYYSVDGYTSMETPLGPGDVLRLAPNGGRPCDGTFPYFRIQFEGCGLTLAVGWPGQWLACFTGLEDGLRITAGQERTHLRLLPGEKIRTPRITVLAWAGEPGRAVNLWRRWYLDHVLPRPDGRPLRAKLACAATDTGEEFTNANEENQIRYMDQFKQVGIDFDVWWIDAGWYPCRDVQGDRRWWRTGTWTPDPERFSKGFRDISKNVARHGADLLVWFEPERVHDGSWLAQEHPEWLLKARSDPQNTANPLQLLDLGNPQCRRWLTDHICDLIAANGIKIYRQDFNFPPLACWRDNDAEDRQGMHENQHVQGYLQFWDDLLRRTPGLWIDSCSSGGRRNDLETMRRSVPLHYSDYGYGDHPVKLAFQNTLYEWLPYFKDCTLSWDVVQPGEDLRFDKQVDAFSYYCGMAPMLFATLDIRRDDYDFNTAVKMIGIWRQAAETLLHGDYYPLTPFSKSAQKWVARQFDVPEERKGLIQAIRLKDCPEGCLTVHPQITSPGGVYVFENPEISQRVEVSGTRLAQEGFTICLQKRSGGFWFYVIK